MIIMTENTLFTNKHMLICLKEPSDFGLNYIKANFCGKVICLYDESSIKTEDLKIPHESCNIYICGDVSLLHDKLKDTKNIKYVVKEYSNNYDVPVYIPITSGQVPINVNNCGVYFRNLFSKDYFNLLKTEHQFQALTESNKATNAFRKGIYLSHVTQDDSGTTFNLLRCSSNLDGPTDNFRQSDNEILQIVNNTATQFFDQKSEFNHVLAQIYENNTNNNNKKAKISAHSDKTKDMPKNGLMAFCTFYDNDEHPKSQKSIHDPHDKHISDVSIYTQLHFRMKHGVEMEGMAKEFSVTLYPNSVFMMSLTTNRLYTHEIRPSVLPATMIPTRMGYVVRCSKTKAIHKDGHTFIVGTDNNLIPMRPITDDDITELRKLYLDENITDQHINYGLVDYSMNEGDYKCPTV